MTELFEESNFTNVPAHPFDPMDSIVTTKKYLHEINEKVKCNVSSCHSNSIVSTICCISLFLFALYFVFLFCIFHYFHGFL